MASKHLINFRVHRHKMKILYIAHRINSTDGSSIHGRAFVESVRRLGFEIQTYPQIRMTEQDDGQHQPTINNRIKHYVKKINPKTLLYYLDRLTGSRFEFFPFVNGMFDSIKEYRLLQIIIKEYKPDILIFRHMLYNYAAYWISRKYNIPVLVEINAIKLVESHFLKTKVGSCISKWAELKAIQSGNHCFVVSSEIKNQLGSYIDPLKLSVVPNGVDTDKFDPQLYEKKHYKNELNIQGKVVVGYVGSYKKWHGLDISLKVIEILSKRDSDFHLVLIGNGECYQSIKEQIRKNRLSDFVTQVDNIPHESVPKYIAMFDYALMSYPKLKSFYFSPLKMFEYMSMGITVVATDIGQIGEIITNEYDGFLIDQPTPENFAQTIYHNRKQLDNVGRNARKLVTQEFNWLANAKKVINICDKLVSDSRQRNH